MKKKFESNPTHFIEVYTGVVVRFCDTPRTIESIDNVLSVTDMVGFTTIAIFKITPKP